MTSENAERQDVSEVKADALRTGELPGPPTAFTCPDCGGSLWELTEGNLLRYQCHGAAAK